MSSRLLATLACVCAILVTPQVFGEPQPASPASSRVLLLDAAVTGADVVAVGESGSILRSSDSGRSWLPVPAAARATLTGISFAPESQRGWAVGHDSLILVTNDAGKTWQKQWQGEDLESSFLDVLALSDEHAIAIGAYGLFRVTRDGGKAWEQRQVLEEDMHLNRISRGPTGTLYLAGERGTLLRSRDDGATWEQVEAPYEGSFYGVLPLDDQTLLAYGLRGHVYRTPDDGATWEPVVLSQPMLIATAARLADETIVLAGQARAQFVSRDAGRHFELSDLALESAIAELLVAPDGTLLAFGEAGATRLEWERGRPRPSASDSGNGHADQ